MKIERGKDDYVSPERIGVLTTVALKGADAIYALNLVRPEDIERRRKAKGGDALGIPLMVAHRQEAGRDVLMLWPSPSAAGSLWVRFYPPMVEI